jgi:bacteriocin biosynthesis cyclodehydratase domain-containing protein
VGSLTLIDDDRVELSNLNRQLLFTENDLGQPKIDVAARALRAHNSELGIGRVSRRVRGPDDLSDVLASQPDLLVATADWPPHDLPRWVNRACLDAGVPWIGAGQFPPRLRVGPMVIPGESACHECLEQAARGQSPLYDQVAEWRAQRQTPDCSVGPISGVIGSLLATEALHFLLGAFRPASVDHALLLDLRAMTLESQPVERQPDCPSCSAVASARRRWL